MDLFFIVSPFKVKHMKEYRLHKFFPGFIIIVFHSVCCEHKECFFGFMSRGHQQYLFYMPGNSAGRRTDGKGVRRLR